MCYSRAIQIESEHNNKENAPRNINFITRKDNDEKNFEEIIEQIKQSHQGKTLGVFSKDKMEGPFCEQWESCMGRHSFSTVGIVATTCSAPRTPLVAQVDISSSIGYLLAVKDTEELGLIRKACEITGKLYSKHLKDQIINIVDSERVWTSCVTVGGSNVGFVCF